MGRFGRGRALARESWTVVRSDRSLLLFPVLAGVCALVAAALFFGAGAGVGTAADSFWAALPFLVVGAYLIIAAGQFCAVALAACATKSLEGAETTFAEGIAAARGRLKRSSPGRRFSSSWVRRSALCRRCWARRAGNVVAAIIGGLANFTWAVATFFVVPAIALEGLGPKDAIKRSAAVVRERWGEGVVGSATIGGAIFLAGILPGALIVIGGIALTGSSAGAAGVLIAVGVVVVVIAGLLQAALSAVFRVALYRFATEGAALGRFTQDQLQDAFRPRRGRRGSPI
jgi:hypothetical protein